MAAQPYSTPQAISRFPDANFSAPIWVTNIASRNESSLTMKHKNIQINRTTLYNKALGVEVLQPFEVLRPFKL